MKLHPLTLKFSGNSSKLEAPFLRDYYRASLPHIRISLVLGAIFYAAFGILDALLMPEQKYTIWFIRFVIVCPVLCGTLLASFSKLFERYMQPLLAVAYILAGGGIIIMIVIAPPPINYSYYAGLLLVFMWGYTFIRILFIWASLAGWVQVILYEIAAIWIRPTPFAVLLNNNFFFISANVIGMLACYSIEFYARRDFFLRQQLEIEKEKINKVNQELEERVEKRTADYQIINRALEQKIADHKEAEEQARSLGERLQRAEKMEALGTLAGGVAHDLNNLLGVIVGYAEMLLDDVNKSSPISSRLGHIMKAGERAAAIVQDLLTLARRGVSGRQVLNLNKIIADCQQSPEFEKLSSDRSTVRVKTDAEPDLLNISGSSVHLGKTLLNLVSNAGEAMPNGGMVTIKTSNQYLDKPIQGYDEVREGDYVVLSVSDTGEGIPAADLKRIFEPFYTKKVMGRSGTGLGLAVVWGTVKDHHGYINVQSEEGKGSTFTLYFPVTREDISAGGIAVAISEYMGRGESILIVDDVKEQRDLAAEMLRKLHYNVTSISSGEEAVAYLKEHRVELIVLDMIMDPGMDGLDTYRSVLEIYPGQKAIIVSGFSESYRVSAAQGLGAGAYVRKPYVTEKLGLAVRKELDRK